MCTYVSHVASSWYHSAEFNNRMQMYHGAKRIAPWIISLSAGHLLLKLRAGVRVGKTYRLTVLIPSGCTEELMTGQFFFNCIYY